MSGLTTSTESSVSSSGVACILASGLESWVLGFEDKQYHCTTRQFSLHGQTASALVRLACSLDEDKFIMSLSCFRILLFLVRFIGCVQKRLQFIVLVYMEHHLHAHSSNPLCASITKEALLLDQQAYLMVCGQTSLSKPEVSIWCAACLGCA